MVVRMGMEGENAWGMLKELWGCNLCRILFVKFIRFIFSGKIVFFFSQRKTYFSKKYIFQKNLTNQTSKIRKKNLKCKLWSTVFQ